MRARAPTRAGAIIFLLICASMVLSGASGAQTDTARLARRIWKTSGVAGGLVVHLDPDDGRLTAALGKRDGALVQGVDRSPDAVREARRTVQQAGRYGRVSVICRTGDGLPYADGVVNLVVARRPLPVPESEVMRVLAPGGAAVIGHDGTWTKKVKPTPPESDDWTHFLHGPDNNARSRDGRIGPPNHLQWVADPRWTRDHDYTPSIWGAVTAGGRIFYIQDLGPTSVFSPKFPGRHALVARDAHSGVRLWQRPIPSWYPGGVIWGTCPVTLNRRVVASEERVFVTDGLKGPVIAVDARTGKKVQTYRPARDAAEILHSGDTLVVGLMQMEPRERDWNPTRREEKLDHTGFLSDHRRGRALVAFDADSGEKLWRYECGFVPMTPCIQEEHVFVADDNEVVSLDLRSGRVEWRGEGGAASLVASEDVLLAVQQRKPRNPKPIRMKALVVGDGSLMWQQEGRSMPTFRYFYIPPQVFFARDRAWMRAQGRSSFVGVDPLTGGVEKKIGFEGAFTPGHHIRCYPAKATERYIITNKRGFEFHDLSGGAPPLKCDWIRGACRLGMVPANGMMYMPPHGCNCSVEVSLKGFRALGSRSAAPADEFGGERRKGPAFGNVREPDGDMDEPAWPTYRHDGERSCATEASVSPDLAQKWRTGLGGELTSPVLACGRLIVSRKDTHSVHALDADSGDTLWSFTAGGPVDSPPTLARGRVVFGSTDGWVYCLRARDGKLAWKFRAAPGDRRIVSRGGVESLWPVHGSLPVIDGTVYAEAGRCSYLDGGLRMYGIDLETGGGTCRTVVHTERQKQDTNARYTFNTPGALSDIFVAQGGSLFMRHLKFDAGLELESDLFPMTPDAVSEGPRAVATAGFLDHTNYSRAFRACGTRWTGRYSARRTQQVAFDDSTIYGCRIYYGRGWKSPRYHPGEGSVLFAQGRQVADSELRSVKDISQHGNRGGREGWRFSVPSETFRWQTEVPIFVRTIMKAGDRLLVAGRPDRLGPEDPYAAFEGRTEGWLYVVSAENGGIEKKRRLPSPPVMDGVIAADAVYVTTRGGDVLRLGAE